MTYKNTLRGELLQMTVETLGRWNDCVGGRGLETSESTS